MDRLLLVEGWIDKSIMRPIIARNPQLSELDICIKDCGGIDALVKDIRLILKGDNIDILGIIADANNNLTKHWEDIKNIICQVEEKEIIPPDSPDTSGTIINSIPRIGIWLMPDNKSCGEIEDFFAGLIPDNDPVWPRSESYIDGIPENHRNFPSAKIVKAKTYAWVAARRRPGLIGTAMSSCSLDLNKETYKSFVRWIEELYR